MALSTTPLAVPVGTEVVSDSALGSTPDTNVRNGPTTVFILICDNSLNIADTYLMLYDNVNPTVGTTAPTFTFCIRAGTQRVFVLDTRGSAFLTALSMAAATASNGTTSPVSAFYVGVICS